MRATALFAVLIFCTAGITADPPEKGKQNRLAKEASPYLRQHGHNPVDWYPWGPEAFEKAKKENKLIFLSIGYSSCHWCHVMEKESFSDAKIAKMFNDNFVCIKVDREERPDIDDVYMTSLQVLGNSGGWPLSMFLTPDAKPIFGGTYWPKDDRVIEGDTVSGTSSILKQVTELWKDKNKELIKQADKVAELTVESLERNSRAIPLLKLDATAIKDAAEEYEFDPDHGGFGNRSRFYKGAKFPRASGLRFLWVYSAKPGREAIKRELEHTLRQMAGGGIYDHIGGGFHRYSTERTWTVPHFEKMLYDNAQLVELYSLAYQTQPEALSKTVIEETLAFVARELTSPEGAFYSALDADSEGKEGEFYVWTKEQLEKALPEKAERELLFKTYVLDKPNFEGKQFVLRYPEKYDPTKLPELKKLKANLLAERAKRERPFLDTKIITAWNGQMIGAYAQAAIALKNKDYITIAEKAADFVLKNLRKDGRLLRIYAAKPNEQPSAKGPAFLEDYAFLIHGFLNLHEATKNPKWLAEAEKLSQLAMQHYGDPKTGAFYTTSHDGEKLFARGRDSYDGAQPSGNGMMTRNLARLAVVTGKAEWKSETEKLLKTFASQVKSAATSAPITTEAALIYFDKYPPAKAEAVAPAAPTAPKASADVATATVKATDTGWEVNLSITKGWHVYANPAGGVIPVESFTTAELFIDGKRVETKVTYPKAESHTDSSGAKYDVYTGAPQILVQSPADKKGKIEIRIKLIACKDGTCLTPSTLKLEPKE